MKNLSVMLLLGMTLLCQMSCKEIVAYEIQSVTIENFPSTNNGNDWDPIINTAPDIKVQVRLNSDLIIETAPMMDVDAGTDYTFNVSHRIQVEELEGEFQLQLIDDDQLSSDQIMETFSFQLTNQKNQFFSDGQFEFSIVLEAVK